MLKVVIVEDEELIRTGLEYMIDWIKMDCTLSGVAKDGAEGLTMICEKHPDVVITDIRMPVMDGIEMIRQARKKCHFRTVIFTGYSDFEYAKSAIQLKVSDYLLKPVDEIQLEHVMADIHREIEYSQTYMEIMELTKNKTMQELEDWSIYRYKDSFENVYVVKAMNMICEQYDKKLTVESVAEELGISISYLSRKLKEFTDQTFLDILNRYRIQKSVQLLKDGTWKVYEIANRVGFSDYKYFCSVFKKYTGMSPTEFVKSTNQAIYHISNKKDREKAEEGKGKNETDKKQAGADD